MTRRILWLASQTALLLGVVSGTTAYASSPVVVGGVQTQIAATGISYSGSNCSTQVAGEWCGPVGIATDSKGNIYVAQYTAGQLVKLDASTHTPTVLLGYGSGTTGINHPQQIAMDSNDNLWIADQFNARVVKYSTTSNQITGTYPAAYPFAIGVDSSNNVWAGAGGTIYEIPAGTASGTSATLKISAAATGLTSIWGIAFDNSGNLWLADNPDYNQPGVATGTIAEFTVASSFATKNTVLTSSALYGPGQILFDSSNNMYVAEENINSVVKFNYSSSYTYGYSASDSYAISNSVQGAEAVARDSKGNLFLTAYGGGIQADSGVVEISPGGAVFPNQAVGTTSSTNVTVNFYVQSGATIGSFAVLDQGVSGLEFNRVTNASTDCTVGTYSSTKVCSIQASFKPTQPGARYGAIQALDASGTALATAYLYGTGVGPSIAYRPGTLSTPFPASAGIVTPFGIAFDASGNMFATDLSGFVKKFASGSTSGTSIGSGWSEPASIKVDGAGNLWVANCDNSTVFKETPDGSGGYTQSTAFTGLNCPVGVDLDGAGNIYIASRWDSIVYKETLSNGTYTQSTIASGLGTLGDIKVSAAGDAVFVADQGNHKVWKLTLSGSTYTPSALPNTGMSQPWGLALDANGNLYVSDMSSNIYLETPSGGSYTQSTLLSGGFTQGTGLALDASGNLFISDYGASSIKELNIVTPPSLSFASTAVGSQSADSPQSATLFNYGNAALTFSVPSTGSNPSISTSFALDGASTCPSVSSSGSSQTLGANSTCNLSVDFIPQAAGSISGSAVLTNDTLNVSGSTQTISLSGTGIETVSQLAFTTAPATTVTAGGNAGTTITVTEQNSSSVTQTSATDTITLTVTGPNGYSQTYTATAVNGVATFDLSSVALSAAGGYTYTASITATPTVTTAVATETVSAATAATVTNTGGSGQGTMIGTGYPYPFSVSVTDQFNNPVQGATVTYSVPASGASAVLSATTATTNASGAASVTGTANGLAGTFNVTATVAGVSTGTIFPTTNQKGYSTTVLVPTPASPITYGSSKTTLTGYVSSGIPGVTTTITGTVTIYNSGTAMGSAIAVNSGAAALQLYMQAGTYTSLRAVYDGDTNFMGSTSADSQHTVNRAPVTLTASSSQTVQAFSTTSTLALTITGAYAGTGILVPGSGGSSTVTCNFYNSSSTLVASSTATVAPGSTSSSAACTVPSAVTATQGTYTATATFNGDTNYTASNSSTGGGSGASLNFSFTVQPVTPTITWNPVSSATNVVYGTSVASALTAAGSYNSSSVAGTYVYTTTVNGSTVTLSSATVLPAGSYTLTVTFTPTSSNYATATKTIAYTVTQATPAITLISSASPVWIGSTVTYTATVTGVSGGVLPTGAVTFYDGSTALGTASLNTSGKAAVSVAPTTSGTHSIRAVLAADTNYVTVTSGAVAEVAVDFTVATSGSSLASVMPGGAGTYSIVVTPVGNAAFPGAITMSVTGLPSGATATFSTTPITSGSSATTETLTITTSATTLVLNRVEKLGRTLAPLSLALLFLPLAGFRRARKVWMRSLMMLVLLVGGLAATAGLSGCSLQSGYLGQTPKTFTVTVTGNNGSFTRTTSVTLTVE